MRSLNEYSITGWVVIGMLIVFVPLCVLTAPAHESSAFYFIRDFTYVDWVIFVVFGSIGVFSQASRAKAVHYEESAKLSVLNYFQSVIQLGFDIIFLHTPFSPQQIVGVLIVLGANTVKWAYNLRKVFCIKK